jgi:hypothetical protein
LALRLETFNTGERNCVATVRMMLTKQSRKSYPALGACEPKTPLATLHKRYVVPK